MPGRLVPLVKGEMYHVFNRGINKQIIFTSQRDYRRVLEVLEFYSYKKPRLSYSKYLLLHPESQQLFFEELRESGEKIVEIISYCFMPNHFHLQLRQLDENGISIFLGNLQNSYTRYFNTKYHKIGPLLQGRFKAILIENMFQLLHVSRYIHLNPYSSGICQTAEDLLKYPWSSLGEYIADSNTTSLCTKRDVLSEFNASSYKDFVLDQADYQRELDQIKHVLLEDEDF